MLNKSWLSAFCKSSLKRSKTHHCYRKKCLYKNIIDLKGMFKVTVIDLVMAKSFSLMLMKMFQSHWWKITIVLFDNFAFLKIDTSFPLKVGWNRLQTMFISLLKMSRRSEDVWELLCAEKVLFCYFS